ncbi:hypothetical protein HNP46_006486 [Pseudomonas nitritireducens]|uniref:Uncharacterized protein n=1 Tax=Pseudomonas nitroreducens TaxID=46680 RepID=A0A7W7KRK8_PSENT|nr:hypothetical protein [Pseudomonas nitritireducens]MBB4867572.1 hypothetical protein [Pseudomonas nitritireducens]
MMPNPQHLPMTDDNVIAVLRILEHHGDYITQYDDHVFKGAATVLLGFVERAEGGEHGPSASTWRRVHQAMQTIAQYDFGRYCPAPSQLVQHKELYIRRRTADSEFALVGVQMELQMAKERELALEPAEIVVLDRALNTGTKRESGLAPAPF